MSIALPDSAIFGDLFSDPQVNECFSDRAFTAAMLKVEAALALALADVELIPPASAAAIEQAVERMQPDPALLRGGVTATGVPVPALIEQIRTAVGEAGADYVHFGATSQDVLDTAMILCLRDALAPLERRTQTLGELLATLAAQYRNTPVAARTRGQPAVPSTFGLRVANWLAPLARHRQRLAELRPRLLLVQSGGAAGTLAAFGERALEVGAHMADTLQLHAPAAPWHTQRDGIAEFANWLTLLTGSVGKMGQDIALAMQTGIDELRMREGGGSSAMPQKRNPVAAELLVTLARMNAGLLANLHQGALQEFERGGAGWQLEWLTLPQMVACTGAALRHAEALLGAMDVDAAQMRRNLDANQGTIMAEAAVGLLGEHVGRRRAQELVGAACREATASGTPLVSVLRHEVDAPVNWEILEDPANYLGSAGALVDRILALDGKS